MSEEVTDLRKNERFAVVQALEGAFCGVDVAFHNLGLSGAQLLHAAALRIGTCGRLSFPQGEVSVTVHGQVIWSRLSNSPNGLLYRSGVQLDQGDVAYAVAIAALVRAGVLVGDSGSLERKRQRQVERAQRLSSSPRIAISPPAT